MPSARILDVPPEKKLTIRDLFDIFIRRRFVVLTTVAFFVAIAALICVVSTRRYLAKAEIQVQKEPSTALGLTTADGSASPYSDALQDNIRINTQVGILQSDSLALRVIHDLNLAGKPDFLPTFSPIGWILRRISPTGPSDAELGPPTKADLGMSPRKRVDLLSVFQKNLKVKPVAGTSLIEISYLSFSPRLAADIVNHLAEGLRDYNFEIRHDATAHTASYLTSQLTELRQESEDLQAKLARAQRESGVLSLGGVDAQGRDQVYSALLDKLQQAGTAYAQAQSSFIFKDAVFKVALTGNPETVSSLGGSASFSGSESDSALGLIQSLRMQQSTLQGQFAEASAKYGPAFPKLVEIQQKINALNTSIKGELTRLTERAQNDLRVAGGVEEKTHKAYLELKSQADALNDKTLTYNILRQEADQSRALYENLFKHLKEADVLADFQISSIATVDPARVPAKPAKPNVLLYLGTSLAGGLLFGCSGALLSDVLDSKIDSLSELELQIGGLPYGILPYYHQPRKLRNRVSGHVPSQVSNGFSLPGATAGSIAGGSEVVYRDAPVSHASPNIAALHDPRSAYVESLRALRTSVLLSKDGPPPKIILVTSFVAGEGKSMLTANLATLFAQQGKRVLVVDGDLRRPTLHRIFDVPNTEGLSSLLAGRSDPTFVAQARMPLSEAPTLAILPAGPAILNPAELLSSEQMREALITWKNSFDFVIIDSSPVLPVTDSVVLSAMADLTLLVAHHKMTHRESFGLGYRLLQSRTERNRIGIVLNAVRLNSGAYHRHFGYNQSVYYGR